MPSSHFLSAPDHPSLFPLPLPRPAMDLVTRNARFPSAKVFCNDELLDYLQNSPHRPFSDSKTLVDLPLRLHPEEVLRLFESVPPNPSKEQYDYFMDSIFINCHKEECSRLDDNIQHVTPTDYTKQLPSFLRTMKSPHKSLVDFVSDLKVRWKDMCRLFAFHDASKDALKSSLISLPRPFFVPGGRFRELYYWDTMNIVKGLVACEMMQSAKDAVHNLLYLVEHVGFVPNGNRVYYLNRSQPPLLTETVRIVFDAIDDEDERVSWLQHATPLLDQEYEWFARTHSVEALHPKHPCSKYSLSLFNADTIQPRPESFKEDIESAHELITCIEGCDRESLSQKLYKNLASAAESGWDFSSRWFANCSEDKLCTTRICSLVPSCLNGIILKIERTLSQFHAFLAERQNPDESDKLNKEEHMEMSRKYEKLAKNREHSLTELMWDQEKAYWFDYDLNKNCRTTSTSVAGLMPAWGGCGMDNWTEDDAKKFVDHINSSGLVQPGGLACTTQTSKEQWDFPNSWPPLIDISVDILRDVGNRFPGSGAKETAETIAMRFLETAHAGWCRDDGVMHEKYDCRDLSGNNGKGGEYEPQTGYGWTNGTALWLLNLYSKQFNEKLSSV